MLERLTIATLLALATTAGRASDLIVRPSAPRATSARVDRDRPVPPLSWTCPMHPEVVEDARGRCPICRMALEPVRLVSVWSCPLHSMVAAEKPGRCPICGRELVRVTMAVMWTCSDRPDTGRLDPGRCADGTQAVVRYTPRPHGNHNPQHGGQFFMAPDNWHHLEGSYPRAGVFRIHLYNDYSTALPREQVQRATGRITVGATDIPLVVAGGGEYLETRVPAATLPFELTVTLRFDADGPEQRFDFAFTAYSVDRPPQSAQEASGGGGNDGPKPRPASVADLNAALHAQAAQIASAIDRRAYSEIWVPALEAKDVALAIDAASGPGIDRFAVQSAVGEVVRAAWLLDDVGDRGNAQDIAGAYAQFAAAVRRLDEALRSGK